MSTLIAIGYLDETTATSAADKAEELASDSSSSPMRSPSSAGTSRANTT